MYYTLLNEWGILSIFSTVYRSIFLLIRQQIATVYFELSEIKFYY
jgi:hypothetical protein